MEIACEYEKSVIGGMQMRVYFHQPLIAIIIRIIAPTKKNNKNVVKYLGKIMLKLLKIERKGGNGETVII